MSKYFRPILKQNPRKEILYFLPDNFIILRDEVYQYDTSEVYYVGQLEGLNSALEYDFTTGLGVVEEKVKEALFWPYNYRLDFDISALNYIHFICNLNTDSMPQVENYHNGTFSVPTTISDLLTQRAFHYAKFFFTEFQYQHGLKYHLKALKTISKNILDHDWLIPEKFSFSRHIFKNLTKPFSLYIFGLRSSLFLNYSNTLGSIMHAYNPIIEINLEELSQRKIYDKIYYTPGQLGQIYYDGKNFLFQSLSDYPLYINTTSQETILAEKYLNFNSYKNFFHFFTQFITYEQNNNNINLIEFPIATTIYQGRSIDQYIIYNLAKFYVKLNNTTFSNFKDFFFTIPNTLGSYGQTHLIGQDFQTPLSFKIPISNGTYTYQINFGAYNNPVVQYNSSYIYNNNIKQNIGIYNVNKKIGGLYSIEPLRNPAISTYIYCSLQRTKSQLYPLGFIGQTALVDNNGDLQLLLFESGVGAHEYSSGVQYGFIGGHTIQKYSASANTLNLINKYIPSTSSLPSQRSFPGVQSYNYSYSSSNTNVDQYNYISPHYTDQGIKLLDSTSSVIFMTFNQGQRTNSAILSRWADTLYENGVLFFKQTPFSTTETAGFLNRISYPLNSSTGKGKYYFIKDFDNTSILELEALDNLQKLQEITPNSYYYDTTNSAQVLNYTKLEFANVNVQNSNAFPFMYFVDKINKPWLIVYTRDNINEAYIYRLDDNTNTNILPTYIASSDGTATIDIYPSPSSTSSISKSIIIGYGLLGIYSIKEIDYSPIDLASLSIDTSGFVDLEAIITKPAGVGIRIVLYTTGSPTTGTTNSYQTLTNSNSLDLDKNTAYNQQTFNIKYDPNETLKIAIVLI